MQTAILIWLKAQGMYLLLMLPTLPIMFLFAEFYALTWGVPALVLFYLILLLFKSLQWFHLPLFIVASFFITLLCTYGAAWHFAEFKNPWNDFVQWIYFPAAGCVAAVAAVYFNRRKVQEYISEGKESMEINLEEHLQNSNL